MNCILQDPAQAPYDGNMFLNRIVGSDIYLVNRSYPNTSIWPPMLQIARQIK